MALTNPNAPKMLTPDDVDARFGIAADGAPTDEQVRLQRLMREKIAEVAQHVNDHVADSRAKSVALTHLEDALMWIGKAIYQRNGLI